MGMSPIRLRPSIASADPLRLADAVASLGRWPYLHIDIEDGVFLPNITFGLKTVSAIAACARQQMDVHLLVRNPLPYLSPLGEMGIAQVSVHMEALEYPLEALRAIRRRGMRAGLALNFKTPPEALEPFLDSLDYVLVMTAEPDGEGAHFCPSILPKLRRTKALLSATQELWVDGGINRESLPAVVEAGATDIVVGRAAFGEGNAENNLRELLAH